MIASSTHNGQAALFLLISVGIPLLWLIFGSMSGSFNGQGKNPKVKSREMPLRDTKRVYDENPLHQVDEAQHRSRG